MADNVYIVHKDSGAPSLDEAAVQLHVPVEALDSSFGVQPIDPRVGDYAVLKRDQTDQSGSVKNPSAEEPSVKGPFSNPRIDTFGPLR